MQYAPAPLRLHKALAPYASYALPGLAACLALVLAAECLAPGSGARGGTINPALPAATAGAPATLAAQWSATALARPLFAADRRPDAASGDHATGLPRLSAIIITGNGDLAIFSADGQKPQLVGIGGEINGDKLLHMDAGEVELLGPAGPLVLRPSFSATSGPTAQQSAAPPAPAAPPSGPTPGFTTQLQPLPRATRKSNPALYLEQNF